MGIGYSRGSVQAEADLESVCTVGDAAVADLLPDADGVVLASEVVTSSKVVTLNSSSEPSEPLSAARLGLPPHVALNLTDSDVPGGRARAPLELEGVAGRRSLQYHVLAEVVTADHVVSSGKIIDSSI